MRAYIKKSALIGIFLIARERHKKEAFALLFGRKTRNSYRIDYVSGTVYYRPYFTRLTYDIRKLFHLAEAVIDLKKLFCLGDMHSHTDYRNVIPIAAPSPEDIGSMREDSLYIVVAISNVPLRKRATVTKRKKSLIMRYCDYQAIVSAYIKVGDSAVTVPLTMEG